MTKLMTLNLSEVQAHTAAAALEAMALYAEKNLMKLTNSPAMALKGLMKIAMCKAMSERFAKAPEVVELLPNEAAALATALRFFTLHCQENMIEITEGDPRLIIGGIQTMVVAEKLLREVCDKGTALAEEEEAEELRKAA